MLNDRLLLYVLSLMCGVVCVFVCVYEIIPYDLLASSMVKSEALVRPIWLQPCRLL